MFTREYLQSLATATVFSRGKDYFRSKSVGRITRAGDQFTAKVHGSYPYKVQLTLRPGGAKLKCNCPYDFDGICKHAVALGLAVLASLAAARTAQVQAGGAAEAIALNAGYQLAFLVGDAPPHLDYAEDADYAVEMRSAAHRGIQMFTVAASGMDPLGQAVWRQIAQYTQATNLFVLRGGAGPQSTGGGDPASSCGGTQTG